MSALPLETYLDSYLAPLGPFLARRDITDIYINRPGELWIECLQGQSSRIDVPELTELVIRRLARQIAAMSAQGISREHPLLAGSLPDGSRVQIAIPPATRGDVAIAIRKHVVAAMSLDDYAAAGAFGTSDILAEPNDLVAADETWPAANPVTWLRTAVRRRKNILISGGTSTGKTTFLNALLREVDPAERLILIEDTPELFPVQANMVGLIAARSELGEASVTAEDLLIAALRMRPDRIVLGEMRGAEAVTFLRAVNTGHPGSLSTIHADSPERAIDQLALLVMQTGTRLAWDDVTRYVVRSLDMIVQLKRVDGRRKVDRVLQL